MVDRMYRVMAGGISVFLQVVDEQDALQSVVVLQYDSMTTDELAQTLAFYYPRVAAACVYASEGGEANAEVEILRVLCPDIHKLIEDKATYMATVSTDRMSYTLDCNDYWGIVLTAGINQE